MSDGYHELRTIVRIKHTVEFNASAVKPFYVDRAGRSVSLRPAVEKTGAYTHAVQVDIGGTEMPEKLQLVSGIRVLDEVPYSPEAQLTLDEQQIGEGPNRIRAVGIYPDGMEVSSAPLSFEIKFAKDS
jgi:hypothetical protein